MTMDCKKIKFYCQFCLQLQTASTLKVPINRKIKQDFFEITQKKLNTNINSEFICCQPCLEEFEAVISFRLKLLDNQSVLEKLNDEFKSLPAENQLPPSNMKEESAEEIVLFLNDNDDDEMEIEYLEEHISEIQENSHIQEELQYEEKKCESESEELDNSKRKYQRKRLKDPIKCPKCGKLFYYKSYFAFHYKDVHSQDRCEVCHQCGRQFKNGRRLNSHMLTHNTGEKKFKCDKCLKEFNYSGDLLRHKRMHENIKPYICTVENCGKAFVQSYALKLHMDVHNKVRFSCDKCGSEFSVKTTLKHHMQKCMNGIISYRSPRFRTGNLDASGTERAKVRYKCFIESCDREFSSRKYLGLHLEREHSLKMENFETTCLDCQMVFETAGDYAKHVKIHSCNYICEMCKVRFKTEEKLQAHTEKFHKEGDDRPYVCAEDECGARFKRAEHLRGHQLYKHSDEKKFSCTECPLKFRQRGEYNVHMRVHQDVKPFSCWKCDHVCKTSSNLRQHMQIVHNEANIYYCNICQATFKYNVDLTQHRKEHTNTTVYEIVEINNIV